MSTDHQKYSLENQAAAISAYAAIEGFEIIRSYEDAGRSGVTTRRRLGLSQMLADVVGGSPPFKTILVLDVSRWGRYQDADEAGHYEFLCRSAGAEVVYTGEGFADGLAGSMHKHMKRAMAAEYSRELSAKVRVSKRRYAEAGHAPGGACPFGFARQIVNSDGTLGRVLDRSERKARPEQFLRMRPEGRRQSETLRRIFRLYVVDQLRPVRIAAQLNEAGRTWTDGKPWTSARVSRALRCDLVSGRQAFGKTTCRLGKPLEHNPPEAWGFARLFEPVVPLKLYKAAQRCLNQLKDNQSKTDLEMLDDLRVVLAKHGGVCGRLIDETPGIHNSAAYYVRFGTLRKAYELIGLSHFPRDRGKRLDGSRLSREEVLDRLRILGATQGVVDLVSCQADQSLPALSRIRAEFGSLGAAFNAAGVAHRSGAHAGSTALRSPVNPKGLAAKAAPVVHVGPKGGRFHLSPKGKKRYGI